MFLLLLFTLPTAAGTAANICRRTALVGAGEGGPDGIDLNG